METPLIDTQGWPMYISLFGAAMLFALITRTIAVSKGRNGWLWGLIGLVTWFVGMIVCTFMPDLSERPADEARKSQRSWMILALLFVFVTVFYFVAWSQMAQLTNI